MAAPREPRPGRPRSSGRSGSSSSWSTPSSRSSWIVSLSLKPADKLNDGKFLPDDPTFDNYRNIFKDDQFKSAARQLDRHRADRDRAGGRARHVRGLRDRPARLPGQGARAVRRAGHRHVPAGRRSSARCSTCGGRSHLFDTWPGLIIPYMTFTLPLAIWTLSAFFREIPWDLDKAARVDGATPFQAFRKVIAPLAAPGVFTSAILVFIFAWNDFLFATSLTSTNRARTVPGRDRVLHRQLAVRLPGRLDRRRVGRRHHPDHHHGAGLPAPHRRRPHVRRGQGLRRLTTWPRSCSTSSPSGTATASRR